MNIMGGDRPVGEQKEGSPQYRSRLVTYRKTKLAFTGGGGDKDPTQHKFGPRPREIPPARKIKTFKVGCLSGKRKTVLKGRDCAHF